jgi:hypothetical protein
MKTTLIFLGSLAVVLGIFAYFAVFGAPTGTYTVTSSGATGTPISDSSSTFATSSISVASSTGIAGATNTTTASGTPTAYGNSFAASPFSWSEASSEIYITAASLEGSQLTFTFSVQMGAAPQCIPLNLRLVADEEGDLDPPNPISFTFPDSDNCNGSANELYQNQTTTFTVDPTALPLLFTTNPTSGTFFEVSTTTSDGLQITIPGTSG